MGNFYMEATQINYRRDEKLKTVDQKLQELSQESAIDTDIAPVFKSTSTYNPGDLVYYRNKLYKCTTQHTGAWAAADFTATDVSTALNAAVGALDETKADYADIAGAFSAETSYTAGDLVIYNGIIYRCTNDHTGDWDADDFSATTIGAELNAINSNFARLRASSSATGTHADKLTELKSTYNALSSSEKNRAFIVYGGARYNIAVFTWGQFLLHYYYNSTLYIGILDVSGGHNDEMTITSNGAVAVQNKDSTTDSNIFELYA